MLTFLEGGKGSQPEEKPVRDWKSVSARSYMRLEPILKEDSVN